MRVRIAAVDLVSNTCFPALAADELGYFKEEGLQARIDLVPMLGAARALREGAADALIAGSVYDLLGEFPDWSGVKLCVALSQGAPWLLTVRADLPARRGDFDALRGLRLTAAPGPDLVFKQVLERAGLDPVRDLEILELPGSHDRDVSFGVFAAKALADGKIDGFWANAMGAETAVSRGFGKVHIDIRRGDDPGEVRLVTFAGLATTDEFIARAPEAVDAAVRAIFKAQHVLRADPARAAAVGKRKFPAESAALIEAIVARDAIFYDPVISADAVSRLNAFAYSVGQLSSPRAYEDVVAVRCCSLWTRPGGSL